MRLMDKTWTFWTFLVLGSCSARQLDPAARLVRTSQDPSGVEGVPLQQLVVDSDDEELAKYLSDSLEKEDEPTVVIAEAIKEELEIIAERQKDSTPDGEAPAMSIAGVNEQDRHDIVEEYDSNQGEEKQLSDEEVREEKGFDDHDAKDSNQEEEKKASGHQNEADKLSSVGATAEKSFDDQDHDAQAIRDGPAQEEEKDLHEEEKDPHEEEKDPHEEEVPELSSVGAATDEEVPELSSVGATTDQAFKAEDSEDYDKDADDTDEESARISQDSRACATSYSLTSFAVNGILTKSNVNCSYFVRRQTTDVCKLSVRFNGVEPSMDCDRGLAVAFGEDILCGSDLVGATQEFGFVDDEAVINVRRHLGGDDEVKFNLTVRQIVCDVKEEADGDEKEVDGDEKEALASALVAGQQQQNIDCNAFYKVKVIPPQASVREQLMHGEADGHEISD